MVSSVIIQRRLFFELQPQKVTPNLTRSCNFKKVVRFCLNPTQSCSNTQIKKDLEALQPQGLSMWWTLTDLNRIISYFFKASTSSEIIVFSRIVKDAQLIKKSRCSSDNSTIFPSEKNSKNDGILCYCTKKSH